MLLLIFLIIVRFNLEITNFVGEKLFLSWHQNSLAIKILELPKNKNDKTFFLLGRLYFVENSLYKSVDYYNKAIIIDPSIKEYYYGRGLAYGFISPLFYDEAESDFKKYIELDNIDSIKIGHHAYGAWAGYNDLAWIYFLKGDFKQSEDVSREGLRIAHNSPWLLNMLGVSLLSQDKCTEATEYLNQASEEAQKISANQFGEAYSGDSPHFWNTGLVNMKETIVENLSLCKEK